MGEKLNATAAEKGKSSFGFAYYLDTCKEERERGVTIQCNTKEFFTDKYHYTIVDAPGHKDYIKNMITGSATADVGLLLVPAEKCGFEAAIAKADAKLGVEEGQTRQHARLLFLLGVEQILVGINKMDACGWSEDRFKEIKDEFVKMLQTIGFKPKKVPFIPYSGFNGDNLVDPVDPAKCSWYKGWSVNPMPLFVFLFPTSIILRELARSFAVPLNKELCDLVIKSDLSHPTLRERRSSRLNSTRGFLNLPDPVTPLVSPSRVLPRTRRSPLVILSITRRTVNSSPSRASLPWLLCKSTLVCSSLDTVLLSSRVPQRLRAR